MRQVEANMAEKQTATKRNVTKSSEPAPGILLQEYNSLIYAHILLCILTIGIVGFLLDRMMGFIEVRLRSA